MSGGRLKEGTRFKTQYDKPGDPLSIDCTMNITVNDPESDPMIHQAFPGGIDDLKEYVFELKGFKDHWVKNMNDPDDTRWEYTYHGRLKRYGSWKELVGDGEEQERRDVGYQVDQVELPGLGTVAEFGGRRDDPEAFFLYTSFTDPESIYRYDVSNGQSAVFRRPQLRFDPDDYTTQQVFYESKDGARVPMFLTFKNGLEFDEKTPLLLTGYGDSTSP